ncbi:MAG: hypothetical protein LKG40_01960 [Lachnospiraceae bacterium]|jgi:hypothetical protein|nr:hypothetical protein [Lachnospiraceae bacterium]MCI1327535.1 hypothetical protein [Lachnospiraceae bacterium]
MAINPAALMKAKARYGIFKKQHPKFLAFLGAINAKMLEPGTVIDVKVTGTDGRTIETNLRLTPEDVESVRMFKSK